METVVKKRRGRKPKNFIEEVVELKETEKKKRGRKKKYEIENSEKINNREKINNFNHYIAYSDDEACESNNNGTQKKISFGNLDITVTKKTIEEPFVITNEPVKKIEDEWSSSEDEIEPIERIYHEPVKYITDFSEQIKEQSLKRIKVVTTLKNVIAENDWPNEVDVCCWWCCHKFCGSPCTLPTKYDQLRKRFTFVGIFCSWGCVKAYNCERNDHMKNERSCLITLLVKQLYGMCDAVCIKTAPPRQTLKMFGGYLDIEEFRANTKGVDAYHLNLLGFKFIHPEITEVNTVKIKKEKKNLRLSRNV
jgi:hypothetical protein